MEVTEECFRAPEETSKEKAEEAWAWLAALPCPRRRDETLQRIQNLLKKEAPFQHFGQAWRLQKVCQFLAATAFEFPSSPPPLTSQKARRFEALSLKEKILLIWIDGLGLALSDVAHAFQLNLASTQFLLDLGRKKFGEVPTRAWLQAYLFREHHPLRAGFTPRQPKWLAVPLHLLTTFSLCGLLLLLISSDSFKQASQAFLPSQEQPPSLTPSNGQALETQEEIEQESKPSSSALKKIKHSGSRWRFTLKTIHPAHLKTRTEDILHQELKQAIRGSTVPGGIQFDLLVPTQQFSRIRERLMDLEEKPGHFTWVRMKPRQNPPKGMEILQIWLTQP